MKPSRNSPCPCGSGLKYKRCHGDEARAAEQRRHYMQEILRNIDFHARPDHVSGGTIVDYKTTPEIRNPAINMQLAVYMAAASHL